MKKLSVIIPVGNEIHNIKDVISSIDFADEIIVVDSFSNDGTYEEANKLPIKVIRRKYEYSSSQKNWAIPQAKYDWILLVDADERVSKELKNEIIEVLSLEQDEIAAYWIGRENYFINKKVNFSGWQNDGVIRLFKRDLCRYEDKYVHAKLLVKGKVKKLKNKLIHNTYTDINSHIKKLNRYAFLQAKDYDKITGNLNIYHFVIKPYWAFFKHYIIQLGFLDGITGLIISFLRCYSVFMRYVNLWLIRRNNL
tara:strand:+ start:3333 stop:4088 length:756 start_codon:yes stop_codon:yes gene_type:complete